MDHLLAPRHRASNSRPGNIRRVTCASQTRPSCCRDFFECINRKKLGNLEISIKRYERSMQRDIVFTKESKEYSELFYTRKFYYDKAFAIKSAFIISFFVCNATLHISDSNHAFFLAGFFCNLSFFYYTFNTKNKNLLVSTLQNSSNFPQKFISRISKF